MISLKAILYGSFRFCYAAVNKFNRNYERDKFKSKAHVFIHYVSLD